MKLNKGQYRTFVNDGAHTEYPNTSESQGKVHSEERRNDVIMNTVYSHQFRSIYL
jgi:hypothetical protein